MTQSSGAKKCGVNSAVERGTHLNCVYSLSFYFLTHVGLDFGPMWLGQGYFCPRPLLIRSVEQCRTIIRW